MQKNSSVLIEYYLNGLIENDESDECAKRLGDIVLRSEDEFAMENIWKGTTSTKHPDIVIDHCSYTIGRIMQETQNPQIVKRGFEMLTESLFSTEIIVDKFAYAAGEIALHAKNLEVKQKALEFIQANSTNANEIVKEKYSYTQNRVRNASQK